MNPKTWLITGVAGFVGSNLLETLLKLNQKVVGIDNFSTGFKKNLVEVQKIVTPKQWKNFIFTEGDICDLQLCESKCKGVHYVLHQAALGSVPRSIKDPIATNAANVTGFSNMLTASKNAKVDRFIYAASSSTYGDSLDLPKVENNIGKPLSPYAVTKYVNELYADVFGRVYGLKTVGLRYFNVFGPRQNPDGAYAAVVPKWINSVINNETTYINGDGETSRDFTYVDNVVQANLLASFAVDLKNVDGNVFNVACGGRTTLKKLHEIISTEIFNQSISENLTQPIYLDYREGDVRHSQADISRAKVILGYEPVVDVFEGMRKTITWHLEQYNY